MKGPGLRGLLATPLYQVLDAERVQSAFSAIDSFVLIQLRFSSSLGSQEGEFKNWLKFSGEHSQEVWKGGALFSKQDL